MKNKIPNWTCIPFLAVALFTSPWAKGQDGSSSLAAGQSQTMSGADSTGATRAMTAKEKDEILSMLNQTTVSADKPAMKVKEKAHHKVDATVKAPAN